MDTATIQTIGTIWGCVVAVAAALSAVMPPPKTDAGKLTVLAYNALQAIAFNFGHAKNARPVVTNTQATPSDGPSFGA